MVFGLTVDAQAHLGLLRRNAPIRPLPQGRNLLSLVTDKRVYGSLRFLLIQRREFANHHAEEASMSMSSAPHDLAAIKHALELGFILAALVLAAAAHGDTRPAPDFAAAQTLPRYIHQAWRRCV
jgi:hypothetical protein